MTALSHILKKSQTETILIDDKSCKDLMIYFTRYVHNNLLKILSLHYYDLIGKIEEHEREKIFDA